MEIVAGALAAGANEVARSETLLRLARAGRMRAEVEKAQAGLPNMSIMATGTAIRFMSPFPWMSRFFCGIFESIFIIIFFLRERWVLLKIPRGDIDGVGEVK